MNFSVLAVLFANLVWGLSPILAKIGLQNIDEVSFLLIRLGLSSLFFLPFLYKAISKIRRLKISYVLMGIGTISIHYYFQVFALKAVPVSWYVFFYALCPVISLFVMRVHFSIRIFIICSLAILGTLIFVDFFSASQVSSLSLTALFGSILTWSFFTWIIHNWQTELSDIEISATTNTLSFFVFALIALTKGSINCNGWNTATVGSTISLALLLPSAFFAHSYALRKNMQLDLLGQYSEPVFGILGAFIFLGESLSSHQLAGAAMMACALLLLFAFSKAVRGRD